jgi:hypothetical protein
LKLFFDGMDELLVQLETVKSERAQTMQEFIRLKSELRRAQQRCDEVRAENRELRVALTASETETQNLFAAVAQIG